MSSTFHHRRKTTTASHARRGRASLHHVLFSILVLLLQRGHIQVKAKCDDAHGCLYTALDIHYDESTKDALSALRGTEPKSESESERERERERRSTGDETERRERALLSLQAAGDDSKTTLTLRGYKGGRIEDQINQDRAMVMSPFEILPGNDNDKESEFKSDNSKPVVAQLSAVFDGHGRGGEKTSQYAMETFPSLLAAKLASVVSDRGGGGAGEPEQTISEHAALEEKVVEALKQTFDEVDKQDPSRGTAGCTATVILRLEDKLYIANAGDSVSFVGVHFGGPSTPKSPSTNLPQQQHNIRIVYQTREDKPDLPEEKARITAAGGYVHIPTDPNGDVPRAYYIDQNMQARYGLAMSRSLGDWKVPGVIAEPIVDVLDLSEIVQKELFACNGRDDGTVENPETTDEEDQYCKVMDNNDIQIFAMSVSDGMMDYLSPNFIGKTLAKAFFDKNSKLHPHTAAEKLVMNAAKRWEEDFGGEYRDDIAIASLVVPFQQ